MEDFNVYFYECDDEIMVCTPQELAETVDYVSSHEGRKWKSVSVVAEEACPIRHERHHYVLKSGASTGA